MARSERTAERDVVNRIVDAYVVPMKKRQVEP